MAAKKSVAKRVPGKKLSAKGKIKVGDSYQCGVCGSLLR